MIRLNRFVLAAACALATSAAFAQVPAQRGFTIADVQTAAENNDCTALKGYMDKYETPDERLSALQLAAAGNYKHRNNEEDVAKVTVEHEFFLGGKAWIKVFNSKKQGAGDSMTLDGRPPASTLLYYESFDVGFPNSTRQSFCAK